MQITPSLPTDRGTRAALLFALVTERLAIHYEHAQWLTLEQGATLAAEWLSRSKRSFPASERRRLSVLSDALARQVAAALSREAGLFLSHELSESLDPGYDSGAARSLMAECERLLDEGISESLPENPR